MSFYDDSTLMFLAAGAAGVDGKADTIKPAYPNARAPLYVTRGSNLTATRVDSNGLIEKGRENLLTYSNDFSNSAWTKSAATITADALISPQGVTNASYLTDDTANNFHGLYSIKNVSSVFTCSIFVKYDNKQFVSFVSNNNGASDRYAYFDLINKTTHTISSGLTASVEDVGNGWLRLSVMGVSSSNAYYFWNIAASNSTTAYVGDGTGRVGIYGAQLEIGLVATEYIESGASTGKAGLLEQEPRFNYPIGGGSPHLLLEPQRSNLVEQSEYFNGSDWSRNSTSVIDNAIISPEGLLNGSKFIQDNEVIDCNVRTQQTTNVVIGNTYTFSVFAKKGEFDKIQLDFSDSRMGDTNVIADLTNGTLIAGADNTDEGIEDYGNGWYRVYVVGTAIATGTTARIFRLDNNGEGNGSRGIYAYGAQFEEGSYPTSYIPNHSGGSVSRESDVYQNTDIDTVTNMSTDECTVFLDVDLPQGREGSSRFLQFVDIAGGGSTYFGLKGNYVASPIIQLIGGGTINTSSTYSLSVGRYKIAIRWLSGTAKVFINGAEVSALSVTDSSAPTSFDKVYGSGAPYRHLVHQLIVLTSSWDDLDCRVLTGLTNYYASFSEMATALNYTIYE